MKKLMQKALNGDEKAAKTLRVKHGIVVHFNKE